MSDPKEVSSRAAAQCVVSQYEPLTSISKNETPKEYLSAVSNQAEEDGAMVADCYRDLPETDAGRKVALAGIIQARQEEVSSQKKKLTGQTPSAVCDKSSSDRPCASEQDLETVSDEIAEGVVNGHASEVRGKRAETVATGIEIVTALATGPVGGIVVIGRAIGDLW